MIDMTKPNRFDQVDENADMWALINSRAPMTAVLATTRNNLTGLAGVFGKVA